MANVTSVADFRFVDRLTSEGLARSPNLLTVALRGNVNVTVYSSVMPSVMLFGPSNSSDNPPFRYCALLSSSVTLTAYFGKPHGEWQYWIGHQVCSRRCPRDPTSTRPLG